MKATRNLNDWRPKTETKNGNEKQIFIPLTLKFNLRHRDTKKPTIIYAVVRVGGVKYSLNSGVKVYPSQWNRKRQRAVVSNELSAIDNRNNMIANNRLKAIRQAYERVLSEMEYVPDKTSEIICIFAGLLNVKTMKKKAKEKTFTAVLEELNLNDSTATDKTKSKRECSVKKLKEFLEVEGLADTKDLVTYSIWERFKAYLNANQTTESTAKTYTHSLKRLMKIFNRQYPDERLMLDVLDMSLAGKKLTVEQEQSKHIVLSEEELKKAYSTGLDNNELETAKRLYILQCLLGCRVSDLKFIVNGGGVLFENDGCKYLKVNAEKNNMEFFAPIDDDMAVDLLTWARGLKGFPFMFNRYNECIKLAFKELGYTQTVEVTVKKGGEIVVEPMPAYQLFHSHEARHTFITLMFYRGVPKERVIMMTGHVDTKMIDTVYLKRDKRKELSALTADLKRTKMEIESVKEWMDIDGLVREMKKCDIPDNCELTEGLDYVEKLKKKYNRKA